MTFEPLAYAFQSVTSVHLVIFGLILVVSASLPSTSLEGQPNESSRDKSGRLLLSAFMMCAGYCLFAPIVGQIFGDKFTFVQVWPSAALLGMVFAGGLVLSAVYLEKPRQGSAGFMLAAFVLHSLFMGVTLNLFLYVAPRIVGWGIMAIPKASWGVAL